VRWLDTAFSESHWCLDAGRRHQGKGLSQAEEKRSRAAALQIFHSKRSLRSLRLRVKKNLWPAIGTGGEGFEPPSPNGEVIEREKIVKNGKTPSPALSPGQAGHAGEDVAGVVLAWSTLPTKVRAAILALVDAAKGGRS